jgi:hypothetical protein
LDEINVFVPKALKSTTKSNNDVSSS